MSKSRIILSMIFLILGLISASLTYDLKDKDSIGDIKFKTPNTLKQSEFIAGAGGGVDSSNDGVAIGLGIISGFLFLSSALLLSLEKK